MGRSDVQVHVGAARSMAREPARQIHLAVGMPANDRMDWLIEKATELGVTSIQPLMTQRSVLKLSGERAEKKSPIGKAWPSRRASNVVATWSLSSTRCKA